MTERYTEHVSTESPELIRANECEWNIGTLVTYRFRRLWNEIVDLREQLEAARRTTPDREAWISVEDRLPEEGQAVAFVVHWPGNEFLHGRVLGGTFHSYGGKMPTFSVPGTGFEATHWMPLPTAPADAARAQGGEKS